MYCQFCQRSTLFDDPADGNELKSRAPEGTRRYRQQYVNECDEHSSRRLTTSFSDQDNSSSRQSALFNSALSSSALMSRTVTSLISPSTMSLTPDDVSRTLTPVQIQLQHSGSILVRAYSRQIHPQ